MKSNMPTAAGIQNRKVNTQTTSSVRMAGGYRPAVGVSRITAERVEADGRTTAHAPAPEVRFPLSALGRAARKERRDVFVAIVISIVVLGGGIFYAGCDPSAVL